MPRTCKHGRQIQFCADCGGSQICKHGRQRQQCKTCGGSSICEHGRRRSRCKECGGSSICEHGRRRHLCTDPQCIRELEERRAFGKEYLRPTPPAASPAAPRAAPAAAPQPAGDGFDQAEVERALANSLAQQEREERKQKWRRAREAQAGVGSSSAEVGMFDDAQLQQFANSLLNFEPEEEAVVEEEVVVEEEETIEQWGREGGGAGSAGSSAAHAAEGAADGTVKATEDETTCNICLCGCGPGRGADGDAVSAGSGEDEWGYTPCGHCFHLSCIFGWVKMGDPSVPSTRGNRGDVHLDNKSCPTCRAPLSSSSSRVLGKRPSRENAE